MDSGRTFIILVGGTIFAVTRDELDQTAGRMARRGEWPSSRPYLGPAATTLLAATVVTSLGAVVVFDDRVPRDGLLDWRTSTGLTGDFFGSVSYNPFVGIQQRLVSNSTEPVFLARITGDLDPDQVYFRLVSMETYSGGQFYANNPEVFPTDDLPWEAPRHAFAGDVGTVRTDIQIERLRMDWLPAAYSPVEVDSTNSVEKSLRVRREDGSIRLEGGLSFRQMQYSVLSEVPIPDIDVLSTTPNGELSPAFVLAQGQEEAALIPVPYTVEEIVALTRDEPPNVDVYLELPEGPEARIADITALAEDRTKNLETDFEKALALEAWFHSPQRGDGDRLDGFAYTTDIDPGHGATELSLWLLDPTSPNYRRGYCENFATAMAVMARTLGIPSRVVLGFTPGLPTGEENVVVVQERNAHAWVELWMPTQGWVRFDPTPRNQGDTRQTFEAVNDELAFSLTQYLDIPDPEPVTALGGATGTPSDPDFEFGDIFIGQGGGADTAGGLSIPNWVRLALPFLAVGALFGGVVPAVKWWRRRRRMQRLHHGDISAAWEEITNRLTDLGQPPQPAHTPTEYAADTDTALNPLAVVYSRSLYGPTTTLSPHHVQTAQRSLASTTENLTRRYTRTQRLLAWYRPGTIMGKSRGSRNQID